MTNGIQVDLQELIALRRYAHRANHHPGGAASRSGAHGSRLRGRGMDFAEVRNYQAGDEIRHMEWRVTARTGRPHIKLYQEERERPVIIITDFGPSMYFGTRLAFKSVIAARLAAILAWTVVKQGDRLGGVLFSQQTHHEYSPRGRDAGVLPFLAGLTHFASDTTWQTGPAQVREGLVLSDALQRARRVAKPGCIIVLISDFYTMDGVCEQQLSRLRTHHDVLAYHVSDPLEIAPPKPGCYAVTDGLVDLVLDTTEAAVHKAYLAYCEDRRDVLSAQWRRLQIQSIPVMADMDLPSLVRQTFPKRVRS